MSKNITVAVIGAGVAGVTAAKCALDEGLKVTLLRAGRSDRFVTYFFYKMLKTIKKGLFRFT